nr:MAG TPA: hypothetical protein [Caudoviricetes sp.]
MPFNGFPTATILTYIRDKIKITFFFLQIIGCSVKNDYFSRCEGVIGHDSYSFRHKVNYGCFGSYVQSCRP